MFFRIIIDDINQRHVAQRQPFKIYKSHIRPFRIIDCAQAVPDQRRYLGKNTAFSYPMIGRY